MKNRYLLTLAAATAAMLLVSCERMEQDPMIPGETPEAQGNVLIPFSAETGPVETRMEMSGGSTSNIVYSAGDKAVVYSTSYSADCPFLPSLLDLKEGAGTKKGKFSGDIVLRTGKTEEDFNTWIASHPTQLDVFIIPEAGLAEGVFTWDAANHDLGFDYSSKAIDSDLEALVKRTVFYYGSVSWTDKKITGLEMGSSYVRLNVTVPSERDSDKREYDVTLKYDICYGTEAFLTPTAKLQGTVSAGSTIRSDLKADNSYTATGTFSATSATGGRLYMALMTYLYLRRNYEEYESGDEQSFTLEMENAAKGYGLTGGKINAFAIPHGKGFTKSVTLSEPDNEDVLLGQPASVRTAIMTTKGADLDGDGRLSKYEAAQFNPTTGDDGFGLKGNTDLTNANFFQYFTAVTDTKPDLFNGCTNLTTVAFPKHLRTINTDTFSRCSSLTTILWGESRVNHIKFGFEGCTSLTSITLPETLNLFGGGFADCTSLTYVDLSLTSVPDLTGAPFKGCTALKTVKLPATLTELGPATFEGCTELQNIDLPAGLTSIGARCFYGCAKIESFDFPATLEGLGTNAFIGCNALTTIRFRRANPSGYNLAGSYICQTSVTKIYVPSSSVDAYKTAITTAKNTDYADSRVVGI